MLLLCAAAELWRLSCSWFGVQCAQRLQLSSAWAFGNPALSCAAADAELYMTITRTTIRGRTAALAYSVMCTRARCVVV